MKTKNLLSIALIAIFVMSCTNKKQTDNSERASTALEINAVDTSVTNVYYFHGKQRCKTCIAVGNLAKETIEELYANNHNVKFIEVDTSDKQFSNLVDKYEVSWNALIIAKGDKHIDITEQAFANAVNTPEVLVKLLTEEVNKNL